MEPSLYEVLGITPQASDKEVRSSYLVLAKTYHPDKVADTNEEICRINEAYEVLSDPMAREAYDVSLRDKRIKNASQGPRRAKEKVDLDAFEAVEDKEGVETTFTYPCRCGGSFTTTATRLANDDDVVYCSGCSGVIRVLIE